MALRVRIDAIPRTYVVEKDEQGNVVRENTYAREGRVHVEYSVLDHDGSTVLYTSSWDGPSGTPAQTIRDNIFAEVQRYHTAEGVASDLDGFVDTVLTVPNT